MSLDLTKPIRRKFDKAEVRLVELPQPHFGGATHECYTNADGDGWAFDRQLPHSHDRYENVPPPDVVTWRQVCASVETSSRPVCLKKTDAVGTRFQMLAQNMCINLGWQKLINGIPQPGLYDNDGKLMEGTVRA